MAKVMAVMSKIQLQTDCGFHLGTSSPLLGGEAIPSDVSCAMDKPEACPLPHEGS